jgi:hypothetical protein
LRYSPRQELRSPTPRTGRKGIFGKVNDASYNFLATAMGESVCEFNDGHTHAEVLAAFDKAIELAKEAA